MKTNQALKAKTSWPRPIQEGEDREEGEGEGDGLWPMAALLQRGCWGRGM